MWEEEVKQKKRKIQSTFNGNWFLQCIFDIYFCSAEYKKEFMRMLKFSFLQCVDGMVVHVLFLDTKTKPIETKEGNKNYTIYHLCL